MVFESQSVRCAMVRKRSKKMADDRNERNGKTLNGIDYARSNRCVDSTQDTDRASEIEPNLNS